MLYSINFVKGQNNILLGILLQDYKRFFIYSWLEHAINNYVNVILEFCIHNYFVLNTLENVLCANWHLCKFLLLPLEIIEFMNHMHYFLCFWNLSKWYCHNKSGSCCKDFYFLFDTFIPRQNIDNYFILDYFQRWNIIQN